MLATRVIPQLLADGRKLVKGKTFKPWRTVGVALQAAQIHASRGVDELLLIDVTATKEGRGPDLALIEELTESCFMPVTVGGGIRTVDQVREVLRAGADKVLIGNAGVWDQAFIARAASATGCQAIVVAIDVRDDDFRRQVCSDAGERRWMFDPVEWAAAMQRNGAGEILLNSITREGTMQGYDLGLIRDVSAAVDVPVVAAGGCSGYDDMVRAVQAGASAVSAGALFQFTDATPREAAEYLHKAGIPARV